MRLSSVGLLLPCAAGIVFATACRPVFQSDSASPGASLQVKDEADITASANVTDQPTALARSGIPFRHQTIHDHHPADFVSGAFSHMADRGSEPRATLRMSVPGQSTAAAGVCLYESPVLNAGFPYSEALLSWNIDLSPLAGFCVEARVGNANRGVWSPYLRFGEGGRGVPSVDRITHCAQGTIDIDYFRSDQRFDRIQYRVLAVGGDQDRPDVVHIERFSVCLSETLAAPTHGSRRPPVEHPDKDHPAVRLPVPFLSQKSSPPELADQLCSPTSVAMVLAYRGAEPPVESLAERIYDPIHHIYGNWPRAVQAAYLAGVPGYLTRFSNWEQVRGMIAEGQPLIISITAEKGELSGAPYAHTSGHLLVLTGFDEFGNVLVNDPAAANAATGQLVYRREQLDLVWLHRKAGAAYVLLPSGGDTGETDDARFDPLVDVADVDPELILDIRYATTRNFTGLKLYASNRCLLRQSVALRLRRVRERLEEQGLGLKVFDGYRPLAAQRKLWSAFPDPRYVANPARASRHSRGTAVDVTLVDAEGRELEMPTDYDDFSPAAHRDYQGGTVVARKNRGLLERAMATEGFIGLSTEWWHFDAPDWRSFPPIHIPPPP